jgi:drug/metabolite transporter (DMT)-like permease
MSADNSSSSGLKAGGTDRRTLVAFVLMVLFASGNAVPIRLSNSALPPLWGAVLRAGGAALVFWSIVALRRMALPKGRALQGAILYGIVGIGVPYALLYWGLRRVPAALGAPILALVPLMTLFFASIHRLEQLHWRAMAGAVIATVGVVIGLAGGASGALHVPSVLALVAGTAFIAEAGVIFKLFPKGHPVVTNAVAFAAAAPILLAVSWLAGEKWTLPSTAATWAAVAYLVLLGSVAMFVLYLYVLTRWTASATSYSFLLIPVGTVVIAARLLGEPLTISFVIGAALALAGVWIGIRSSPRAAELACAEMPSKAICWARLRWGGLSSPSPPTIRESTYPDGEGLNRLMRTKIGTFCSVVGSTE